MTFSKVINFYHINGYSGNLQKWLPDEKVLIWVWPNESKKNLEPNWIPVRKFWTRIQVLTDLLSSHSLSFIHLELVRFYSVSPGRSQIQYHKVCSYSSLFTHILVCSESSGTQVWLHLFQVIPEILPLTTVGWFIHYSIAKSQLNRGKKVKYQSGKLTRSLA